ncbi:MAG: cysteine synthase family protein [Candidatus Promineofilum sp.]|nr:cysteine synthase family protein [Promineifilum sp.]
MIATRDNLTDFRPHSFAAPRLDATRPEDLIGNTPLLRLDRTAAAYALSTRVTLLAKAEWYNPGGSVKDRAALHIIREAERRGLLRPGMTLLDATSGNTGIAYAMLGAARGYRVKLAVPENVSPERLAILRAYGAELILTDPLDGSDGAILEARRIATADPTVYYADQYNNPANWQAHYLTTAEEMWRQTDGTISHFVAGLGTSGTFTGVTRRLRELNPAVACVSAQPDSPFNGLEGWKHMATAIVPGIYDATLADRNVTVRTEEAHAMARFLARHEGVLVGVSAAAGVVAALHVARQMDEGVVVTVLPDSGYKYLSERFWLE